MSVPPSRHIHPSIIVRLMSVPPSRHIHSSIFDICAAFLSHSPVHHQPVDICAAFPSHSPVYQIDIHNGFHHVDLCDEIYKHPNHKLRFSVPRYPMAGGTQGCRQESSLTRRGYCSLSPPGQCIVWGGRSGTTMPIHFTDTCHWHLYDSFDANTLLLSGLAKTICYMTIADVSNNNLLGPQRELIQWRSKHCINMNHVNELMLTPMLILLVSMVTMTTLTPCVYAVA